MRKTICAAFGGIVVCAGGYPALVIAVGVVGVGYVIARRISR